MQGNKTHEEFQRKLERKDDMPKRGDPASMGQQDTTGRAQRDPDARQSEMPVSFQGMNQESSHNKHNDSGQSGHKPQKHSPAEEGGG